MTNHKSYELFTDLLEQLKTRVSGSQKHALALCHRLLSTAADDIKQEYFAKIEQYVRGNLSRIRVRRPMGMRSIYFTQRIHANLEHVLQDQPDDVVDVTWQCLAHIANELEPGSIPGTNPVAGAPLDMMGLLMQSMAGGGLPANGLMGLTGMLNPSTVNNLLGAVRQTIEDQNVDIDALTNTVKEIADGMRNTLKQSDDPSLQQLSGLLEMAPFLQESSADSVD